MRPFSYIISRLSKPNAQAAAIVALAGCGVLAASCSGPTSFSPGAALPQNARPMTGSSPTPSPIPFIFQNVDDPNSKHNQVNGMNQLSKIVGTYGAGQGSNIPQSYDSVPPFSKFLPINMSGEGTVATALSSNKIQAGYVIDPTSLLGIWSFVRIGQVPTFIADPNEGTGNDAVTEIWGINDSENAVGFYVNSSGLDVPFELSVPTLSFTDLHPPGAVQAQATGIDGKGNISGWETMSNGSIVGFFLKTGTYYTFSYPGAQATYALSLNWSDQIVGDYVDGSGATHGFLLTGPTRGGAQQIWQSIDEPNAAAGTWVTGINNHHDICGYYVDASGVQHGFYAVP